MSQQIEAARFVSDVPEPLQRWADSLVGHPHRGRKVVAGWGWDGRSPGVEVLFAPKGRGYVDAPLDVWRQSLA